jgi:hypothetical protein
LLRAYADGGSNADTLESVSSASLIVRTARRCSIVGALLDALPLSNSNRFGASGECGACGACGAAHETARDEVMPSLAP